MALPGQQSLENFYVSVQYQNPAIGMLMADDIRTVALYGLLANRKEAYPAVVRLRDLAQGLPAVHAKILDHALQDLGYPLDHIYSTQKER